MDGNTADRISQKDNCRKEEIGSLLEDAAEISGGVLSSIQALAGTTACKGVQIARLKDWAKENDCWINSSSKFLRISLKILQIFEDFYKTLTEQEDEIADGLRKQVWEF